MRQRTSESRLALLPARRLSASQMRTAAVALILVVASACGAAPSVTRTITPAPTTSAVATPPPRSPTTTSSASFSVTSTPLDRQSLIKTAAETARLLADPAQAEAGIWSLLANLAIGVYTPKGHQVLAGSETSQQDFWLYDFEVPILADMAGSMPQAFSRYHALLSGLGYPGSVADLAALYRAAYAEHPQSFEAQLFSAMGLDFSAAPDLTRLQSWLLLLDSFVPPNGSGRAVQSDVRLAAEPVPGSGPCDGIVNGFGIQPVFLSLLQDHPELQLEFNTAVDAYYAIHGPLLASALTSTLTADPTTVAEGRNGPGESSAVDLTLLSSFQRVPIVVDCGVLWDVNQPNFSPPAGVLVAWEPDFVLSVHRELSGSVDVSSTDSEGIAKFVYTAQQELGDGLGQEESATGRLVASYPARSTLSAHYKISDPRLLAFVPVDETADTNIAVTWHGDVPTLPPFDPWSLVIFAPGSGSNLPPTLVGYSCYGRSGIWHFLMFPGSGPYGVEKYFDLSFDTGDVARTHQHIDVTSAGDLPTRVVIDYNLELALRDASGSSTGASPGLESITVSGRKHYVAIDVQSGKTEEDVTVSPSEFRAGQAVALIPGNLDVALANRPDLQHPFRLQSRRDCGG